MLLRAITRVAVLGGQRAARATGIKGPRERSHASKSHVVIMLVEDNVMREEGSLGSERISATASPQG